MEKEIVKRKEILVYPEVQWKMLMLATFPMLFFIIVLIGVHFIIFSSILDLNLSPEIAQYIFELRSKLTIFIFITVFIVPNIVVPLVFIFSHRVVGPIYHLRTRLKDFNSGKEVVPISFRPGDYFTKVSVEFNTFLERNKK